MITPLSSACMKSAMILDLIDLSMLLMLLMCMLASLIYLLAVSLFMDTMICLWEEPLVVMLMQGFGLLSPPLIIFWTWLIFLFWSFGNISLILSIWLVILDELKLWDLEDAWAYDFFWGKLIFLKYLETSLTSLGVFARISRGRRET